MSAAEAALKAIQDAMKWRPAEGAKAFNPNTETWAGKTIGEVNEGFRSYPAGGAPTQAELHGDPEAALKAIEDKLDLSKFDFKAPKSEPWPAKYDPDVEKATGTVGQIAKEHTDRWNTFIGDILRKPLLKDEAKRQQRAEEFGPMVFHGSAKPWEDTKFKLPEQEIGVHVGTQRAAHDIMVKTANGKPEDWDTFAENFGAFVPDYNKPRIFPLRINVKNPLRLEDLGTWYPGSVGLAMKRTGHFTEEEIHNAVRKAGSDIPKAAQNLRDLLHKKGFDGIVYENVVEDPGKDSYILTDLSKVRSTQAAFDPLRSHLADFLAGGGAIGVGISAETLAGMGEAKAEVEKLGDEEGGAKLTTDLMMAHAQREKLRRYGEKRAQEEESQAAFDPFDPQHRGLTTPRTVAGKGKEQVLSGLDAMAGLTPSGDPPDIVRSLVQKPEGAPWTEGEKDAWRMLSGAATALGGGFTTLFSYPIGAIQNWMERSGASPEAVEAGKSIVEAAPFFGIAAAARTGARVMGAGQQASKFLQAQRAAAQPSIARAVQSVLSPTSLPGGEKAAGVIRQHTGQAARDTATSIDKLREDHAAGAFHNFFQNNEKKLNQLSQFDQWQVLDYMEGRSRGKRLFDPEFQQFADAFRDAMDLRKSKIQATTSLQNTHLIDDYVSHYWKNPQAARAFVSHWSKQGSGAALKVRTLPTIADGLRAGLEPITTNPFEIGAMYIANMDRYIANNRILDAARAAGDVKYAIPGGKLATKLQGAGWVPLKGRLSEKQTPVGKMVAHAPQEWATVYNNFVSQGIHANEFAGRIYEGVRNASNMITSAELGLSGFHAITMTNEAWIADIAKSVSNIAGSVGKAAHGDFAEAMKLLSRGTWGAAKAPFAPYRLYRLGKKFESVYLDRAPGNPGLRRLVNLHAAGGGRAVGRAHAPDYRFTAAGSYFDALRRGTNLFKGIGPARMLGRIFETVAQPLFDKYIPRLKNGAFADLMHDWLAANPTAGRAEQLAAARRILDSVDNRFGEMIQDNIFWHNGLKQSAMLGMRSYSWNLGTIREIAGGGLKALRHPGRLSIGSKEYDPRTAYVIALPMVAFMVGNVYQYLKTGKPPKDMDDALQAAITPRTGGMAPGVGGRGRVEERTMIPGYMKDVMGWMEDPWREAMNKRATLWRVLGEVGSGEDWRGDPIISKDPRAAGWMKQAFDYAYNNFGPFSLRQYEKGLPTGTGLNTGETFMGMRPAPAWAQDPKGLASYKRYEAKRKYEAKARRERREKTQRAPYGGPIE